MLDAGFTTVRNVGADAFNDVGLKQAIDEGYAVWPARGALYALGATGGALRLHASSAFHGFA